MVSTHPIISKSSSSCTKPLVTVPSAPITVGITVTLLFHSFSVILQGLRTYLSFNFLSVLLCGQTQRQSSLFGRFSFFLLTITTSDRLAILLLLLLFHFFWVFHSNVSYWLFTCVSLGLRNFSQHSRRFQQCCGLYNLSSV